ncbi:MAG: hypothetical protein HW421_1593 [Ignavibacteria bacterium]|nr:hypothetical protein [Ignavibacteria bacterium]
MQIQYDYSMIFTSIEELKKDEKNNLAFDTVKEVSILEPDIKELMKVINESNNENWIGYTRA